MRERRSPGFRAATWSGTHGISVGFAARPGTPSARVGRKVCIRGRMPYEGVRTVGEVPKTAYALVSGGCPISQAWAASWESFEWANVAPSWKCLSASRGLECRGDVVRDLGVDVGAGCHPPVDDVTDRVDHRLVQALRLVREVNSQPPRRTSCGCSHNDRRWREPEALRDRWRLRRPRLR